MLELLKKLKESQKTVYVHLSTPEDEKQFLFDAEEHGIIFSDGAKPTEKQASNFFAVHPDMTMNYIGIVGRIAYQCKADNIICFEYKSK